MLGGLEARAPRKTLSLERVGVKAKPSYALILEAVNAASRPSRLRMRESGFPGFVIPAPYRVRDRFFAGMTLWNMI